MTRPDFGPGDYGQDDPREGDDLRAADAHARRIAGEDAREMRETGTYTQRDYEMDVA